MEIEGVTLGETRRPILLFETGLPTRYYIPKLDVRMDLLEPTESITRCPYKGVARYWSARVRHAPRSDDRARSPAASLENGFKHSAETIRYFPLRLCKLRE